MGFYLAWVVGGSFVTTAMGARGVPELRMAGLVCSIVATVAVLAAIVVWSRNHTELAKKGVIVAIGGACAAVYPLVACVGGALIGPSIWLVLVGALFKGVASAVLFMVWNELFCKQPLKQVGVYYSGAYLLSVVLQVCMSAAPLPAAMCLEVAIGAGSACLVFVARKSEFAEPTEEDSAVAGTSWSFPFKPLAIAVMFTFASFFIRQMIPDPNSATSWIGGGVVALVTLVCCLAGYKRSFDASKLQYVAVPLLVAGVLLYCLLGRSGAAYALVVVDAGNVAFRIFLLVMMCNICYRFRVPALWLFGIMRIAMMLAEGLGVGGGMLLMHYAVLVDEFTVNAVAYALIVLLVAVVALAQHDAGLGQTTWSIVPKGLKGETKADQLESVLGAHEMLLWRCSRVSRRYGLTHREEEVLGCLADGKTKQQIQDELVISEGTARTHISHIYSKLGVHSREEAVGKLYKVE